MGSCDLLSQVFHLPYMVPFCSVQASHPAVPETAVIGYPHDIKGEGKHHGRSSSSLGSWCPSWHFCKKNRLWRKGGRVFMGEALGFLLLQVEILDKEPEWHNG